MKKQFIAECLGTFALSFVVLLSVSHTGNFAVPTILLAGLTLGLFVYSVGHVSGTHINPAVTLGLWSIKKITARQALFYIGAQVIGAIISVILVRLILLRDAGIALTTLGSFNVFLAEAIGMFFFSFGIASVVYDKTPGPLSGIIIGASLVLGGTFAFFLGSDGVVNPAVALAIGSFLKGGFSFMYILGPIVGSMVGMNTYKMLVGEKEVEQKVV